MDTFIKKLEEKNQDKQDFSPLINLAQALASTIIMDSDDNASNDDINGPE